jgi:hypothetical protein
MANVRTRKQEVVPVSILPPKGAHRRTSVSLPIETWAQLDALVDELNAQRDPPDRFSRDELMNHLLVWAAKEARKEAREGNTSRQGGRKE